MVQLSRRRFLHFLVSCSAVVASVAVDTHLTTLIGARSRAVLLDVVLELDE